MAREKRPRILVVDDSPTVLRVMEGVLAQAGYEVTCLESGRDVVETAHARAPDLIFVDFAMPDVNGYAVCRALGEHPELETIPIVIMNTRGDPVGERFIRDMGIVDHISKPFAPEALLAVVQHTLEKLRGTDPALRRRPAPASTPAPSTPAPGGDKTVRRQVAEMLVAAIDGAPSKAHRVARLEDALGEPELLDRMSEITAKESALAGDLGMISIAEVMQLLSLQRQTGFLNIRHGQAEISIAFLKGGVRFVRGTDLPREFLLGSILVRQKLIAPEELDLFLSNRKGTSRRFGSQVVRLGYLSRDDLQRALKLQSSELVYEMLRWGSGRFSFQPQSTLPADVMEFEFDLTMDELLMEGFRRVDEWGLIESAIPSFDRVPARTPGGVERVGRDHLTAEEQQVLDTVDGKRTVQDIINHLHLATFDVARVLYRLVSAHLVGV